MKRCFFLWLLFILMTMDSRGIVADEANHVFNLQVGEIPASKVVMVPIRFSPQLFNSDDDWNRIEAETRTPDGQPIVSQLIPKMEGGAAMLLLDFSKVTTVAKAESTQIVCTFRTAKATGETANHEVPEIVIRRNGYTITHRASQNGGFPAEAAFRDSKSPVVFARWADRVYHKQDGPFDLANDRSARLRILSDGPICTIVEQRVSFCRTDGQKTDSNARALYHWFYFKGGDELVQVNAIYRQDRARQWHELHFMELHPGQSFTKWRSLDSKTVQDFVHQEKLSYSNQGSTVYNESGAITFLSDQVLIYDGKGDHYIMMDPGFNWEPWESTAKENSGWFTLNPMKSDASGYSDFTQRLLAGTQRTSGIWTRPNVKKASSWEEACIEAALISGRVQPNETTRMMQGFKDTEMNQQSPSFVAVTSRDLALVLSLTNDSKASHGALLFDLIGRKTNLSYYRQSGSLFKMKVVELATGKTTELRSDSGWDSTSWQRATEKTSGTLRLTSKQYGMTVELRFNGKEEVAGMDIVANVELDKRFSLEEFETTVVPLRAWGWNMRLLNPVGPGVIVNSMYARQNRSDIYPTGWLAMPWFAVWDEQSHAGLYIGAHDPAGNPKWIQAYGTLAKGLDLNFKYPVPDDTKGGNRFVQPGAVHLVAFEGDWYDAAILYRDWVRAHALWYPQLTEEGRPDSPLWIKEISLWCQTGGDNATMPDRMKKFKEAFGVPGAIHWYNWHVIPFDNDYPHFLPAKKGFREAVRKIQKDGDFFVMPYINGRLWDTKDHGNEVGEFTKIAVPSATKQKDGKPYVESYGSKEADGKPVQLAVMCPVTSVWQNKVRENVLRLMNEENVLAVYIDQVAAAQPVLCFDPSHGHSLGGGAWWNEGYWKMLKRIRSDMKTQTTDISPDAYELEQLKKNAGHLKNRALTTECNGEPFVSVFDGYLTWHWQFENAVPAFSVVYGGTIAMFGRGYAGDSLAWRMKAAESLAFGEQIGWFDDSPSYNPDRFDYLRGLVRFRHNQRQYFYKGEMARPVRFLDPVPERTADWQWAGSPTPVSAPIIRTGTWRILDFKQKQEGKNVVQSLLLLFTNYDDTPVKSRVTAHLKEWGITPEQYVLRRVDSEGKRSEPLTWDTLQAPCDFPARTTWGFLIEPKTKQSSTAGQKSVH